MLPAQDGRSRVSQGLTGVRQAAIRFDAMIQGRSRMRYMRQYGSVRRAVSDDRPYRDFGLGPRKNRRGLRRIQTGVVQSGRAATKRRRESGTDDRFFSSVAEGLRPAKFHKKVGESGGRRAANTGRSRL